MKNLVTFLAVIGFVLVMIAAIVILRAETDKKDMSSQIAAQGIPATEWKFDGLDIDRENALKAPYRQVLRNIESEEKSKVTYLGCAALGCFLFASILYGKKN